MSERDPGQGPLLPCCHDVKTCDGAVQTLSAYSVSTSWHGDSGLGLTGVDSCPAVATVAPGVFACTRSRV